MQATLTPPAPEQSLSRWLERGAELARSSSRLAWDLGDWLLAGERSFGSVYAQAVEATGLDGGYLRNVACVCRRFEPSRRRDTLTISHHDAVRTLDAVHADELLDRAEREQLSVRALRALAAAERGRPAAASYDPLTLRADAALRELNRLCADVEYLLNSDHADRLRSKLEAHRVGAGTIADLRAALSEFAAEAATGALEAQYADCDDLGNRNGFNRRMG